MLEPLYCANPNCGAPLVTRRIRGRCRACYNYFHRTKHDRPEELIVRIAVRYFEDDTARRIRRQAICSDIVFLSDADWIECDRAPGHRGDHRGPLGTWRWFGANLVMERIPALAELGENR